MMIIDVHTHVFSDDLIADRKRVSEKDRQFACLHSAKKSKLAAAHDLELYMKHSSIDTAVAMGFPWESESFCSVQNDFLSSLVMKSDGRIQAFGSVPLAADDPASWIRLFHEKGFSGIGETAFYINGMDKRSEKFLCSVLQASIDYRFPFCLHLNEPLGRSYDGKYDPSFGRLFSLLMDFKKAVIIFSHWGGGLFFYELMRDVKKTSANFYYDTSASPFIYTDAIYRIACDITGHERILFGSDYPLLKAERYLPAIREACSKTEAEGIMGKNASALLASTHKRGGNHHQKKIDCDPD